MSEPSNVIRLVEKAPGYSAEGVHELCQWLRDWADNLESPGSWMPKSLIVVVESDNGGLGVISQSLESLCKARLTGLLQIAAIRASYGESSLEECEP